MVEDAENQYWSVWEHLRMTSCVLTNIRASGKHSRGAHKAFLKGDYEKANMLSKKAMKERMEADQLHNEAAKKIFEAQNSVNKRELWELDLHGLHANEAVDVLQHRLLYIEALLSNTMCASEQVSGSGSDTDGSVKVADKIDLGSKTVSEARVPSLPFGQKLNVITGIYLTCWSKRENCRWGKEWCYILGIYRNLISR